MLTRRTRSEQVGFYLLLTVLAILSFWLIRSYLDIIAFSLMTVVIVKPVYDRVLGWVGGRAGLAVTLTLLVIALVIIVPMWIALSVIASQLGQLIATAQQPGGVPALTAQINAKLAEYLGPEFQIPPALRQKLVEFTVSLGSWVANFLVGLGMGIPSLFARLFIFIGILGALLPNYHSFVIWLKQLSPLDDQIDAIFLRRMKLTIWAMFLAIFVIAVVQGLVMGLFIWFAGVPFTPLWTLIAIVAAMLPLGASLVPTQRQR